MKNVKNILKNSGIRSLTEDQDSLFKRFINIWFMSKNKFFTRSNTTFLAWAIGMYLQQKYGKPCNVLVGYDTRTSGPWIKDKIIKGISGFGHQLFDTGIVPTPFIAKTIKDYQDSQTGLPFFQFGIIITASHNPAEYNGVKFITPEGYLNPEDEIHISTLFYNIKKEPSKMLSCTETGTISNFDSMAFYESEINKQLNPQASSAHIKIVLDCANGATSNIAKKIFLQYYPNIATVNDDRDGSLINKNSGCSNQKLLIQTIQKHKAAWGCAFDGDGDRVIIANNNGDIFDGDDILIALSQHPKFAQEKMFIGTIMTNNAIQQYFEQNHKTFARTDVGERNIIQTLKQYHAQLGSEACGHITIMDHAYCSDGIFAALLFFETIFSHPEILTTLPKKFPQLHANIPLNLISLSNIEIQNAISQINQTILPGRVIARASNTEPLFRLTIEHPNIETANQIMNKIKSKIVKNK